MPTNPVAPRSDRRLLDVAGAADYLNDSPRHVRSLWERREIAAIRIGRKVRFDPQDLDRYIESQRVNAVH